VADGLTIGLLGGSFEPAHGGHLYVSLTALKELRLDYVWWLVSPGNPLKGTPAPFAQRLAIARKIARHPRLVVSDIERQLSTRYTVDTVKALQRRFPGVRFVWLMGSDNLKYFHRWRNWQEIARRLPLVAVVRPGSVFARGNAVLVRRFGLSHALKTPPCVLVLDGARNAESATRLRSLGPAYALMLDSSPNRRTATP
jgi:nicotinate-nucleotide adenylyltransferase